MTELLEHTESGYCAQCEVHAVLRTCGECGLEEWVLDCGCMDQPTPLSADPRNGQPVCDECYSGA